MSATIETRIHAHDLRPLPRRVRAAQAVAAVLHAALPGRREGRQEAAQGTVAMEAEGGAELERSYAHVAQHGVTTLSRASARRAP